MGPYIGSNTIRQEEEITMEDVDNRQGTATRKGRKITRRANARKEGSGKEDYKEEEEDGACPHMLCF